MAAKIQVGEEIRKFARTKWQQQASSGLYGEYMSGLSAAVDVVRLIIIMMMTTPLISEKCFAEFCRDGAKIPKKLAGRYMVTRS